MCFEVSLDDRDPIIGDVDGQFEDGCGLGVVSEDVHHRGPLGPAARLRLADDLRVEDALGVHVQLGIALPLGAHLWGLGTKLELT